MSDKVKLTREQAECLKENELMHGTEKLVQIHAIDPNGWLDNNPLHGLPLDTIIRALYIGYEVEQTPEEKLLQYYTVQKNSVSDDQERTEVAIVRVLEFLGMKVKGINE
jgi:hypothetical protein